MKHLLLIICGFFNLFVNAQTVVINELMASNSSIIADPSGEFDDWIELYNNASEPFNLSNFYLSDNPDNLNKWKIPEGTVIPGNSYYIVWADEDSSQGLNHANFKLSSIEETLYLLDPDLTILDSASWLSLATDVALARNPNGTGSFVVQTPTFNADNSPQSINDISESGFAVFPNPANEIITITAKQADALTVYNAAVKAVYRSVIFSGQTEINTAAWANGIYLIKRANRTSKLIVHH